MAKYEKKLIFRDNVLSFLNFRISPTYSGCRVTLDLVVSVCIKIQRFLGYFWPFLRSFLEGKMPKYQKLNDRPYLALIMPKQIIRTYSGC